MRHFSYLAVLVFIVIGSGWLEVFLRVQVYRRWKRLLLALTPAAVIFVVWDVLAIRAGHWTFDPHQMLGIELGPLPLEELLFFLVVPVAAILAFEAVRKVTGWRAE
ncbi:lycopene cyclase domain-containing protein [Cryptosporangium phraense]|uniref:Lycopene cyclase domain-containing protein n=1 Tax=Cryptosporangium phraense TaxID=2593070 RepID=A0A545ALE9_9ACTN|nr:lycopene cyclase domain-containing protein [Cryptosporangium phraense]TQS41555.1 lycopene cyclase domain-containing protein [Cryptosporangium phraense]